MFNKNIKVERPEGTKIYHQRDCRYVYYVTGSDYKKDKKYVVEKRVCIGKMIDKEVMNPNEDFFQLFELDGEEEELPEFSDALQIGSHALVIKIMDDLGISDLIRGLHREEGENLLKNLITYMIVRQTSAMQHYADFSWSYLISSKKHWDDTRILEYLKSDIDYAQIDLFITQWNKLQPEHSGIYISYDSTNMNTAADGVEMAEYGRAKDDDELPQVNISYAVNHKDATPIFYEMYPGSIIDNTQCTHMVDRAKEYGYKNVGIILDRGYFNTVNIRYFGKKGYDFLMMIKTRSIFVRELIDEARLPLITKTKYFLPEHKVIYISYDSTNKNCQAGDIRMVEFGHAKDDKSLPIM